MRKSIKVIFTVSIILNMVFVGIVGGIIYHRWSAMNDHRIKGELSPQARNIVAKTFQASRTDIRADVQKSKQARKDLYKILTAPDFDPQAFEVQAKTLEDIQGDIQNQRLTLIKIMAQDLSVEDRKKLARRMISSLDGRSKQKRGGKLERPRDQRETVRRPAAME